MRPRGFSMVEVLVTLTVAAIALLGLLALQAKAASVQQDAFHRRHAAELVAQFAERMRSNHLAYLAGAYALRFEPADAAPSTVLACAAPCTASAVAARDLDEWRIELRRRIPGAAAYVRFDASDRSGVDVGIAWPEPQAAGLDPACAALAASGAAIPAGYRCYRSRVFP
jgi:type IV pilus modification protein PilV